MVLVVLSIPASHMLDIFTQKNISLFIAAVAYLSMSVALKMVQLTHSELSRLNEVVGDISVFIYKPFKSFGTVAGFCSGKVSTGSLCEDVLDEVIRLVEILDETVKELFTDSDAQVIDVVLLEVPVFSEEVSEELFKLEGITKLTSLWVKVSELTVMVLLQEQSISKN